LKSKETNISRIIVGRVYPDEDLIDSIISIVKKHDIKGGLINIIGAFKKVTIGYYDIEKKDYNLITIDMDLELVSCIGNIAWKEGEPLVHLHISVGKSDYSIIGGHLSQPSIVSITAEVYILEVADQINRVIDNPFNLSLLNL
jgi:predicted DNA-binding protein with PD1-like motif